MHWKIEEELRAISDAFFSSPCNTEKRPGLENMYQAFTARLCLELRVDGYENQGVVGGDLAYRHGAPPRRSNSTG